MTDIEYRRLLEYPTELADLATSSGLPPSEASNIRSVYWFLKNSGLANGVQLEKIEQYAQGMMINIERRSGEAKTIGDIVTQLSSYRDVLGFCLPEKYKDVSKVYQEAMKSDVMSSLLIVNLVPHKEIEALSENKEEISRFIVKSTRKSDAVFDIQRMLIHHERRKTDTPDRKRYIKGDEYSKIGLSYAIFFPTPEADYKTREKAGRPADNAWIAGKRICNALYSVRFNFHFAALQTGIRQCSPEDDPISLLFGLFENLHTCWDSKNPGTFDFSYFSQEY